MKKYNIDPLTGQLVEDRKGHLCLVIEYDKFIVEHNLRKARLYLAEEENKHLQDLFDLQYTRTLEAGKIWREETGNPGVHPDLGVLIGWLLERKDKAVEMCIEEINKLRPYTIKFRIVKCIINIRTRSKF